MVKVYWATAHGTRQGSKVFTSPKRAVKFETKLLNLGLYVSLEHLS
jgi:hypothetical protein